jgi:ABC-2 type transport system ATP-binding protein
VVEVHVRSAADVPRMAGALRAAGHSDVRTDLATRQVGATVEGGGRVLMDALRAVEEAGVEVEDVALRQPKLDEVFLTLTGQPATSVPRGADGGSAPHPESVSAKS